ALGRHGNDLRPVAEALDRAAATRNKWDLFHGLAGLHCISGVVQNTRELTENEQLKARGFFVETEIEGQACRAPGPAAKLSESPWRHFRPAPTKADKAESGSQSSQKEIESDRQLPLAGIRVLTFTQAWSGTFGTEILSLLGADVVQIEGRKRPDVWRGNGAPVPRAVVNPVIEQSPLNTNGMFNSVNLNKRAITLDMTRPEGREIFWQMLPGFDIVAENFSPKVMASWGITLESLREVRPDIIFASLSGYGQEGPLARYPANGNTMEPMSGFSSINGYNGDSGANTGGLIPDPISGYHFAGAIMAALHYRQQTGQGQRIDLSMMESVASQLGDRILDYTVNGRIAVPAGNRHPRIAPHNVYRTGDDRWIAIATEDERQWQSLAEMIGIDDNRFSSMEKRKQHEIELDDVIGSWCKARPAEALESQLITHGVVASVVRGFLDTYRNPPAQLLERNYLVPVTHPESGTHHMPTMPWVLSQTATGPVTYSPCFGEHSKEVFRDELGMTEDKYNELEADGITGTTRL
ncbi:MAG: CoA transferase, partial [Pseudomonadales bacterium]|nr:CoA transferase [Pseudomonadales bacterium]